MANKSSLALSLTTLISMLTPFGHQRSKLGTVKASDLEPVLGGLNANQRTYQIRKLVDAGMLQPIKEGARQYTIGFANNMLLRGVVKALTDEGFIPPMLAAPVPPAWDVA